MKLVDYDKYNETRSPRSIVLNVVVEATLTGVFLGIALAGARLHDGNAWHFAWPLTFALIGGARALKGTLVALHNCPPFTKAPEDASAPRNASV